MPVSGPAIERAGKAKGRRRFGRRKARFSSSAEPRAFISNELIESTTPIEFIPYKGPGYQGRGFGYKAELLPRVCWVFQDALLAGKLRQTQKHIGEAAKRMRPSSTAALFLPSSSISSSISPVAIFITLTAVPITSPGRFWPLGPLGNEATSRGSESSLQYSRGSPPQKSTPDGLNRSRAPKGTGSLNRLVEASRPRSRVLPNGAPPSVVAAQ